MPANVQPALEHGEGARGHPDRAVLVALAVADVQRPALRVDELAEPWDGSRRDESCRDRQLGGRLRNLVWATAALRGRAAGAARMTSSSALASSVAVALRTQTERGVGHRHGFDSG